MSPDAPASAAAPAPPQGRALLGLLSLAAAVGVVVSLAAWVFLELIHQVQVGVFEGLPKDLGYANGAPWWWSLPVCGVAGLLVALAILRLPGFGGHVPAHGLVASPTAPVEVPGVILAALASVGLGLVLGPEAPLPALGPAARGPPAPPSAAPAGSPRPACPAATRRPPSSRSSQRRAASPPCRSCSR